MQLTPAFKQLSRGEEHFTRNPLQDLNLLKLVLPTAYLDETKKSNTPVLVHLNKNFGVGCTLLTSTS
jgi:hypothetical protein